MYGILWKIEQWLCSMS